jgi:HrpA-like RNA helicase
VRMQSKGWKKFHGKPTAVEVSKDVVHKQKQIQLKNKLRKQAAALPVSAHKDEILSTLESCQTMIVVSATGSGKTTQIPQFIFHSKGFNGKVAVTQPRKVAAITIASRVSEEMGCDLGQVVGYSVRFDHKYDPFKTKLKYLTDGMLLREALLDPNLSDYKVIVLDEAHERTVNTDVLFALLKNLQRTTRPDLKLVVMSATLQTKQFVEYFGGQQSVKVLNIPGRTHPVDMLYTSVPQKDYIDSTVLTVCQIHLDRPLDGDILVFLTGQEDIETCSMLLKERVKFLSHDQPGLTVLPFYAALPQEQQLRVFNAAPSNSRKVVLATNIAETSLTISNIKYVVDCGLAKKRQFAPQTGVEMLAAVPISRAEAWQRAGRAGREQPGMCFRLYTEQTFDGLKEAVTPDILRSNLSVVVLQLKSLGVENVLSFDFIDRPHVDSLKHAIEDIFSLGCLTEQGELTDLGVQLAKLPVDPRFGKTLLAAKIAGCLDEVLIIVACISVESLFYTPREEDEKEKADNARNRFTSSLGDHITLLRVYQAAQTGKFEKNWCKENFIHHRSILKARDIRTQLDEHMSRIEFKLDLGWNVGGLTNLTTEEIQLMNVRRCLLMGLFANTARRQQDGTYKTLMHSQSVHIHPGSTLFSKKPQYVMFSELVMTSKQYVRGVSVIEGTWFREAAPSVFK